MKKNTTPEELGYIVFKKKNKTIIGGWSKNNKDYFGQKVHYIGIENGLGGYRSMINKGWYNRADFRPFKPSYLRINILRLLLRDKKNNPENLKIKKEIERLFKKDWRTPVRP